MNPILALLATLPFVVGAAIVTWALGTADWHRVLETLASRGTLDPEAPAPGAPADDRWRRVHLDADRRAPFGGTSRPR